MSAILYRLSVFSPARILSVETRNGTLWAVGNPALNCHSGPLSAPVQEGYSNRKLVCNVSIACCDITDVLEGSHCAIDPSHMLCFIDTEFFVFVVKIDTGHFIIVCID